jgi:hypothetical protein
VKERGDAKIVHWVRCRWRRAAFTGSLFCLLIVNSVKNALLRNTAGNGSSKMKMFNPEVQA